MNKSLTANRLVVLRKQKGLSQEQLANKSGVALRTIQRIEAAQVSAHLQTLSLLAAALDTELENLIVNDEDAAPDNDNRKWLILMHVMPLLGSFVPSGNLLAPFLFWLFKKDNSAVDMHGRAVLNFQITMSVLFALAVLSMFVVFPPIGIFIMLSSIPYNIVMVGLNTWRVSEGKDYSYPISFRIFKKKASGIASVLILITLSFQASTAQAQSIKRIDGTTIWVDSLQKQIKMLMDNARVAGLEIAIFNKNKLVYKEAFGEKNSKTKEPLQTSTSIYGASLSKAVFSVFVMKLVEEGKLDLDKPLQGYLPKPIYEYTPKRRWHDNYSDFESDSLYKMITARMCLNHTTGLPNWRWDNADQKLSFAFIPGSRYSYSGEGMVYLQTVIEKMFDRSFEQLVQETIFDPIGMKNSAYTWLTRFEADFAYGHNSAGKLYKKDKDNEPRAPSTLETTLDDYTLFIEAVLQGKLLKRKSRVEMFKPQIRLRSISQMGPCRVKIQAPTMLFH